MAKVVVVAPPRKPRTPAIFSRGVLQRTVFDQLRRSPDGIDATELTDRIMRQKGWDTTGAKRLPR